MRRTVTLTGALVCSTAISFIILTSPFSSADVVDDVVITVPVSCNMTSELDTAHTATINPGQNQTDIGTTNFTVFCNDNSGYAIYAIGYSNEEYGNTKLLATINNQLTPTYDIITGTATSGATSNWSMKLNPVAGTYAPTIENGFGSYSNVPTEYTKVATFASSTDFTIGSSLQSTYQAYIAGTQPAGTYAGKVKYTLVHPNDAAPPVHHDQVGVIYHANGSSFTGGTETNRVVYSLNPMYISETPTIYKSSNLNEDGTQNGSYTGSENIDETISFPGASKIKVVLDYDFSANSFGMRVWSTALDDVSIGYVNEPLSGQNKVYVFSGDTVNLIVNSWSTPDSEHDYGAYLRFYPVYETEQTGTVSTTEYQAVSSAEGTYATTTDWYGSWYTDINGEHYDLVDEADIRAFISDNIQTLGGTTIDLMRGLTFDESYERAGKSTTNYTMQGASYELCKSIAVTQTKSMTDIRDNNTYLVGKLKDGHCWMLDNLALDPTDSTTAANMNESNTNASAAAITNLLNGGSTTTGWSSTPVANVNSGFYSYTAPMINNASKNTLVTSYGPASSNGQAKVGIYYNYCAASAGTYCYENSQGVDAPNTLIDASEDICPANWRMPTGGNDGEYGKFAGKYSTTMDATSSASLQYNLSTPLSGYFVHNSAGAQGQWGSWWSSTCRDGNSMYDLGVDSTNIYPFYYYARFRGYSMRCLVAQ